MVTPPPLKLLSLKETLNDTKTIKQITELLKTREITKIDRLIDLIFVASQDIQIETPTVKEIEEATSEKKTRKFSDVRPSPVNFNEACFMKVQNKLGIILVS